MAKGASRKREYQARIDHQWEQVAAEYERDLTKEMAKRDGELMLFHYLSDGCLERLGGMIDKILQNRRAELVTCPECRGAGAKPGLIDPSKSYQCGVCGGKGRVKA